MAATTLSQVYPLGSRLNEAGRLEVGGCDVVELAKEFGTPAYVYAEDDMRARAREFQEAFGSRTEHFEVIYASKAFPCTAAYRLFAEEGLSCDVASARRAAPGARAAGSTRSAIYMHGNNKTEEELQYAVERGVGTIVLDSFHEIERLQRIAPRQRVMLRVTPGIKPSTHSYIQTGQVDSKFGFAIDDVPRALEEIGELELVGLHAHIGSQIFELEPFEKLAEVLGELGRLAAAQPRRRARDRVHRGRRAALDRRLRRRAAAARPQGRDGPVRAGSRARRATPGVTIYTVGTVKEIPGIRTYVAVDGGMSDNLRPMLYGARYEAEIADRFGGDNLCTVAGMHCESSDILVRDVMLDDPKPGDVLVIPATGAYGHAMANNYNSLRRPPVIFCKDGDARVVVRRETFDDLTARDVRLGSGSSATERSEGHSTSFWTGGRDAIEAATGLRPEISGVLTRSQGDFDEILEGSDLIVEVMGGTDPAREYILRALRAGKHVVTANKQVLSQHGEEIYAAAREGGAQLRFEASVGGVVPVIRVINETLAAAHIERVHGIVNGTTNFILSEMTRTGETYDEALAQAQELGYAEADPTEDVNGKDAAAKMAIIARLAFNAPVSARPGAARGHREHHGRRHRVREGARALAEARRDRRARERRDLRARVPGVPVRRAPARVGRRRLQRGHDRVAGDHGDHALRARARAAARPRARSWAT